MMAIDTLEAQAPAVAVRPCKPGSITLARHGEPALSRKVKLHSSEYRDWWGRYEEGGLLAGQAPPELLKAAAEGAGEVVASTRARAVETARAVCGERAFALDPRFIEAPLPPPKFPRFMRFSPRTWGVISRFWWWFFDHHHQEETRGQATARAHEAARALVKMAEEGQDVLVLAHGFFNGMVGVELRRMGWKLTRDEGFRYWSARRFEKR